MSTHHQSGARSLRVLVIGGRFGDGKSTTINSILKEKNMASSSGMGRSTWVVQEFHPAQQGQQSKYRIFVHLFNESEVDAKVAELCDQMMKGLRKSTRHTFRCHWGHFAGQLVAICKCEEMNHYTDIQKYFEYCTDHGTPMDQVIQKFQALAKARMTSVVGGDPFASDSRLQFDADTDNELRAVLDTLSISTPSASDEGSLWPLVHKVNLHCKNKVLENGGIIYIDTPSELGHDLDETLQEEADVVLLVVSREVAAFEWLASKIEDQKLVKKTIIVLTHIDKYGMEGINYRNLTRAQAAEHHGKAILEEVYASLGRWPLSDAVSQGFRIIPVSNIEYQKYTGTNTSSGTSRPSLSKRDTGIPIILEELESRLKSKRELEMKPKA